MSTNKTSRLKFNSWVGTDYVKRTEFNENFQIIDDQMVTQTTAALTYYVRTDGNDANTGTANTAAGAFKTIQAAINKLPQALNHSVTINVAAGVYNEDVVIDGFVGKNAIITLQGDTVTSTSRQVKSITVTNTINAVVIQGFNVTTTTGHAVTAIRCGYVGLSNMNIIAAAATYSALFALSATILVSVSVLSNHQYAIYADHGAKVTSLNNTGTGNTTGLLAIDTAQIGKSGTQPSGTTNEYIDGGGFIGTSPQATTANITLYVSTTGNDSNDGLTAGTALRNIQTAISRIPQVVNHTVTINVASGTYNEAVTIMGKIGTGVFYLNGDTVVSATRTVTSVEILWCKMPVIVTGFNATQNTSRAFGATYSDFCIFDQCQASAAGAATGFYLVGSRGNVTNCFIANRDYGIILTYASVFFVSACGGSGNSVSYMLAATGSIINADTNMSGFPWAAQSGGQVFMQTIASTNRDLTIYVNTATGNDKNDGLTSGTPVKTIGEAIRRLPQVINHNINISVAAGTYAEDVIIRGFSGPGSISLIGDSVVSDSRIIQYLNIDHCTCTVSVQGFKATKTSGGAIDVIYSTGVILTYCRVNASTAANPGIYTSRSLVSITSCEISNRNQGLWAANASLVFASSNTGAGNAGPAYQATDMSSIGYYSTMPSAAALNYTLGGGQVIPANGVVNAWGDNTTGYRSHARANKTDANLTVNNGVWTKVTFNNIVADTLGEYNTSLSRLVAKTAGIYQICATVTWASATLGAYHIAVNQNGIAQWNTVQHCATTGDFSNNITCEIALNVGDYVEIAVLQSNGAAKTVLANGLYTHVEMTRIA